ncbi:MAG: hypothetical protein ACRDTA_22825 [Pseudonocardiaceae bacterium]
MSFKTERLEVRVDSATKERIDVAAARLDQSASAFDIPDDAPALTRLVQRERQYHRL